MGTSPKLGSSPRLSNSPKLGSPKKISPKSSFSHPPEVEQMAPVDSVGTVILRALFDFLAETEEELPLKANDYLKLLERPGDGWLRVKHVANSREGLIPASYVKITVNDLINPITHQWLNEIVPLEVDTTMNSDDLFDFEKVKKLSMISGTTPVEPLNIKEEIPVPKNITVSAVLKNGDKYFYRIDVKLSNGDVLHFCKLYQDFYDLHCSLAILNHDNLPNFPQPIKSSNSYRNLSINSVPSTPGATTSNASKHKKYLESILIKSNELNGYINRLTKFEYYQTSKELLGFINNTPQIIKNPSNQTDEFINDNLLPDSINVIDLIHPYHNNNKKNFSPTAPLPMTESASLSSFSSLIDSYEKPGSSLPPTPDQISPSHEEPIIAPISTAGPRYGSTVNITASATNALNSHKHKLSSSSASSGSVSSSSRDRENSSTSEADSIFSKHSPITPQNNAQQFDDMVPNTPITPISPIFEPKNNFMSEFIKIKVMLNNRENDIIVLKIKNSDLTNMKDLKKLISYKIYKDTELINHYKLMVNERSLKDEDLLNVIKSNFKTTLNLVRIRGSI